MLKISWNLFLCACALITVIWICVDWYEGNPARFFVWLFAVFFCVSMFLECLKDAFAEEANIAHRG